MGVTETSGSRPRPRPRGQRADGEADVPWSRLEEEGSWCGPALLRALGFCAGDLPPRIAADVDVLIAALTARLFACFEPDVRRVDVFARFERSFVERHPRHVGALAMAWRPPPAVDPLRALFFDDYARWLYEMLTAESVVIQPAWLAAHAWHATQERRPLTSHGAHLAPLCEVETPLEERLLVVETWLYDTLLLDVCALALALLHRGAPIARPPLRDLPVFAAVLRHRGFRRTREAVLYPPRRTSTSKAHSGTRSAEGPESPTSPKPRRR